MYHVSAQGVDERTIKYIIIILKKQQQQNGDQLRY